MRRLDLPSLFSANPLSEVDRNDIAANGVVRISSAVKVSSMPVTVYIDNFGEVRTTKGKEIDQRRVIGMYSKVPSREAFLSDIDATMEGLGIGANTRCSYL